MMTHTRTCAAESAGQTEVEETLLKDQTCKEANKDTHTPR